MKFWIFALATFVVSCSAYNSEPSSGGGAIGRDEAINTARAEIARRHIRLPLGIRTSVIKDEIILEFMPEIPIYAVSFYAPDPRRSIPLYRVFVRRDTGKVYDFIDTHIIRR